MNIKKIGINGVGNTGISFLLLHARRIANNERTLPLVILRDSDRSAFEIVEELTSGDFGASSLPVEALDKDAILIGGHRIEVCFDEDAGFWSRRDVSHVVEATGAFLTLVENVNLHIHSGGARQVIVTAPLSGEKSDASKTIIAGFNEANWTLNDPVVDNASCTSRGLVHLVDSVLSLAEIRHLALDILHPKTRGERWRLLEAIRAGSIQTRDLNIEKRKSAAPRMIRKLFPRREFEISFSARVLPTLDMSRCVATFVLDRAINGESIISAISRKCETGRVRIITNASSTLEFSYSDEDLLCCLDEIAFLRPDVVTIPFLFDNRWASAASVYQLLLDR